MWRRPIRSPRKGRQFSKRNPVTHATVTAGWARPRLLLVGIAAKSPPAQLAEVLKHPTAKMNAGGMPAVDLPPDDLKALIAYVESFK